MATILTVPYGEQNVVPLDCSGTCRSAVQLWTQGQEFEPCVGPCVVSLSRNVEMGTSLGWEGNRLIVQRTGEAECPLTLLSGKFLLTYREKRGKEKRGNGEKRRKIKKREGGKLKTEGGKVTK